MSYPRVGIWSSVTGQDRSFLFRSGTGSDRNDMVNYGLVLVDLVNFSTVDFGLGERPKCTEFI